MNPRMRTVLYDRRARRKVHSDDPAGTSTIARPAFGFAWNGGLGAGRFRRRTDVLPRAVDRADDGRWPDEGERMKRGSWRQERQFGVSVGLALVVISAWLWRRGYEPGAIAAAAGPGALLVAFGVVYPRALAYPNRAWMAFAAALSWVSTRVVLAALFFLVLTPVGAWRRRRGRDPLNRRAGGRQSGFWQPYSERQADSKHYERMF